ncbi:hypothetical protein [uncultured Albimonas sp.]|mgnify:FL=1|uniref:hypothetical protein n=1 Tax=uncultured Albimonas sp. TaxID=1331701 RepID=UPI0030EB962E
MGQPMTEQEVRDLKTAISAAAGTARPFGLCIAAKPADTVFLALKSKSPAEQERLAKQRVGKSRTARGEMRLEGGVLRLCCEETPAAGLAEKLREFFRTVVGASRKVAICDAAGAMLEGEAPDAGARDARTRTAPPRTDPVVSEDEDEAQATARAEWTGAAARLEQLLEDVFAGRAGNPATVRDTLGLAQEAAGRGDFARAVRIAERVESRLKDLAQRRRADELGARYAAAHDEIAPKAAAAIQAGVPTAAMIRTTLEFAEFKAAAGELPSAIKTLVRLADLLRDDPVAAEPDPLRDAEAAEARIAAARVDFEAIRAEVEAADAVPRGTRRAEALHRQLDRLKAQLDKMIATRDLAAAPADVVARIAAVAGDLRAEAPAVEAAETLRARVLAEAARHADLLSAARRIYDIGGAFAEDIAAFASTDRWHHEEMARHAYDSALSTLRLAVIDARVLVARQPEFDALKANEAQALQRLGALQARSAAMAPVPDALPETLALHRRWRELDGKMIAARDAHDWAACLTLADELDATMDALDALKPRADAAQTRQDDIYARWNAVAAAMAPIPGQAAASPRLADWKEAVRAIDRTYQAAARAADLDTAETALRAAEDVVDQIPALLALETTARANQAASAAAYGAAQPLLDQALEVRASTPRGLKARDALVAAHEDFADANAKGDPDWQARLDALEAAARAMLAREPDERNAARKTFEALQTVIARTDPICQTARTIAEANRPTLDADLARMDETLALARDSAADRRWMQAISWWQAARKIALWIKSVRKKTAKTTRALGERVKARVNPALADRLREARALSTDVHPEGARLRAELDAQTAEFTVLKTAERWHEAGQKLDAIEATLRAFDAYRPTHDALNTELATLKAGWKARGGDVTTACAMVPSTEAVAQAIHVLGPRYLAWKAAYKGHRYAEANAAWPALLDAVDKVLALKSEHDAARPALDAVDAALAAGRPARRQAEALAPLTPELKRLARAREEARVVVDEKMRLQDFAGALAAVPALDAAAKAQLDAARATVTLPAGSVDPRDGATLAADLEAELYEVEAAKAQAARAQAKAELAARPMDELRALSTDAKLQLLADLRAGRGRLDPDEAPLQARLYEAMTPSPEFLALETGRQQELARRIAEDEDLQAARANWKDLPLEARVEALQRTVAVECEIYGMAPATVEIFEAAMPAPSGYFNAAMQTVRINGHPSAMMDDFLEMLDTVVHENVHNYQAELVRRLEEGLIDPDDPEYDQARIFQANSASGGYIKAETGGHHAYKTQPLEWEAWAAGKGVRALVQGPPPPAQGEAGADAAQADVALAGNRAEAPAQI